MAALDFVLIRFFLPLIIKGLRGGGGVRVDDSGNKGINLLTGWFSYSSIVSLTDPYCESLHMGHMRSDGSQHDPYAYPQHRFCSTLNICCKCN